MKNVIKIRKASGASKIKTGMELTYNFNLIRKQLLATTFIADYN